MQNISCIGIRILSLYFLIRGIPQFISTFLYPGVWKDPNFLIPIIGSFAIWIIIFVILWRQSENLSKLISPKGKDEHNLNCNIKIEEIYLLCFVLLGLMLIINNLPGLCSIFMYQNLTYSPNHPIFTDVGLKTRITEIILKIALGIFIITKSNWLLRIVHKPHLTNH